MIVTNQLGRDVYKQFFTIFQIVNGPEILDKFVGEAEKNIRGLFAPAEIEYKQVGDKSALHVIILGK